MTYNDNGYVPRIGYAQQFRQAGASSTLNNGLFHFWKLDETSGSRLDSVGTYHMSQLINGPTYETGVIGNALKLVQASSQQIYGVGTTSDKARTWAAWFKTVSVTGAPIIMGGTASSPDTRRQSEIFWSGTSIICTQRSSFSFQTATWAGPGAWIADGNFHLIIASCDPYDGDGYVRIYADGDVTAKATSSAWITDIKDPADPYGIGGWNAGYHDGSVDLVAMWNRELTSDERLEFYGSGAGWQP
jgi:hypothetical protein